MEDVALYTVYYSHYHVRAAEAAAVPPVPRKRQGIVCFFLALGALCGMATVAVGFVAHNSAIIWPVVAVGLIGVVAGFMLAHRQATGSWVWGSGPSSARASLQSGVTGQQAAAAAAGRSTVAAGSGGRTGGFHLPMYYADALDVEMGVVHPQSQTMLPAIKTSSRCGDSGDYGGSSSSSGSSAGDSADAQKVAGAAVLESTAAATAAEYGAVMCGFPVAGADGWIDTRPVLVLQPHPYVLLQPIPQLQTDRCDDGEPGEASVLAALAAAPPHSPSCEEAGAAEARVPPSDPQQCGELLAAAAVRETMSNQIQAPPPPPPPPAEQ